MSALDAVPEGGPRRLDYDPSDPGGALMSLRRLREEGFPGGVTIFDLARFPADRTWAYVADGINRSGGNPLRGLGSIMEEPFVDLSGLYTLPDGAAGVVAVALGERYPGELSDRPVCSHLHDAAILAHTAGLPVTGVLVEEFHVADFDFRRAAGD